MSEKLLREIKSDVQEIREQLIELIKQGAINTQTLVEHERRSTNLETRLAPLEKEFYLLKRLAYLLTSGASLSFIVSVVKRLI